MIVGLVLAGGRATRLGGGDKPLLPLGDTTILETLLARLAPQVEKLAISANGDPARFARFNLEILPDIAVNAGPLAGVAAGLQWALAVGAQALLTVPGDTPFMPPDLAARLSPAPAWAESAGAIHPLVALWPTSAPLAAWLESGASLRVRAFGEALAMRTVHFPDTPDPFFNINSPQDLSDAQMRVLDEGRPRGLCPPGPPAGA